MDQARRAFRDSWAHSSREMWRNKLTRTPLIVSHAVSRSTRMHVRGPYAVWRPTERGVATQAALPHRLQSLTGTGSRRPKYRGAQHAKSPNLPLPLPLPLPGALPPQPAHSLAPSRAPCLCPQGVPRRVSRVCRVSRPRIGDRGPDSSARAQRPRLWVRISAFQRWASGVVHVAQVASLIGLSTPGAVQAPHDVAGMLKVVYDLRRREACRGSKLRRLPRCFGAHRQIYRIRSWTHRSDRGDRFVSN